MKRKTIIFGFLISIFSIGLIGLPYVLGASIGNPLPTNKKDYLRRVSSPSTLPAEGPMRIISKEGFFYEDFEKMTPGLLDSGWTTFSTPGHPSDNWSVGTLGTDDKGMNGTSGYKYAYILGNRDPKHPYDHDAWLFSPSVSLKAGEECKIEFFTYMAAGYKSDYADVNEILEVVILDSPKPEAVVSTLDIIEDGTGEWAYNLYEWTAQKDGEYYLGFHSLSPFMSNATLIDDIRLSTGPMSSFVGAIGVDMGDTDLVAGSFQTPYYIQNQGDVEMVVDVIASSPEVKVLGMPVTVPPHRFKEITIEFTPSKLGKYTGQYVLSTSDPSHPEVELIVISDVKDIPVTDFHVEDFEGGGPKGWSLTPGVNTDYIGGHNGARSFYVRSFYTLDEDAEVGFKTHYCNMGTNPELSLWYKLIDCDLMGTLSTPTDSEKPILEIYITDDYGKNWNPIYRMLPGTETAHKASDKFQEIRLSLPQYANKCCRVKTVLRHAGNPLTDDFILLIDDVAIGTRPDVDLKLSALHGNSHVITGKENTVKITVENLGNKISGNYTIDLIDENGKVYASKDYSDLKPGTSSSFNLQWIPDTTGNITLKAIVKSAEDQIEDNNVSNTYHADVILPNISNISIGKGQMYLSNGSPVNFAAKESEVQTIYYANELGIDAGEITSVTFMSVFDNPYLSEDFELYIAETDRYNYDDNEFIDAREFTKVFSGNMFMPAGQHEFTIPFDKPYTYKGGNLVIKTHKCSEEFLNTKRFLVYMDDHSRSISSTSTNPGTLAAEGYALREPSNVYAAVTFNIYKDPFGAIKGAVTDTEGNRLTDVKVSLDGTQLYSMTGKDGSYSLPEVKAASRSLSAVKYGFYPSNGNNINVEEGKDNLLDITLTPYPKVTLKGTVTTSDGEPVSDAKVVIEGYAYYSAVTDENGNYEISGVYGDIDESYNLRVESLHFETFWNHRFTVGKDNLTYNVTLDADIQPAFNLKAVASDQNVSLTWESPLTEFRHDDGVPVTYLGWNHGHAKTAIFTTYRQKILVKEIKFYLSDVSGPHANINVFLVGLNKDGYPDASDMRWLAKGVTFKNNEWTSVVLDNPVEMENFAIGISGDGYIGLGASASDSTHPFESLMHFWAGDDMYNPYDLMDFEIWTPVHPMLRVCGDYLGDPSSDPLRESLSASRVTRPSTEYDIFRIECDNPDDWKHIGSTRDLDYSDETFCNLTDGKDYQYAVVARYGAIKASPALSDIVRKEASSVNVVLADDISFGPNPFISTLSVSNPEKISQLRFISLDGTCLKTINSVAADNDVSDLPDGIYIVVAACTDGKIITEKMIKK